MRGSRDDMPRSIIVGKGGGFDKVFAAKREAPAPGPGEIKVWLRASSLNYHDCIVMSGVLAPQPRVPMADGAGEVFAVDKGVDKFALGDRVISTFFLLGSIAIP